MAIDLTLLARHGAQARIIQLQQEIDDLRVAFPDLDGTPGRRRPRRKVAADASQEREAPLRKRKPMTAAQKRAIGERMSLYWASRRKTAGNDKAETGEQAKHAAAPGKRVMSAEARERIAAAQRKRWRKVRRAGKKR